MKWRDIRTCTPEQSKFLDALMNKGEYAKRPRKSPQVLYGGAGYAGKSHVLRTACFELNATLAQLGFPGQWGVLVCKRHVDLVGRQAQKLVSEPEFKKLGEFISGSRLRGMHFKFHDERLGGFYLRHLADPESWKGMEVPWILVDELTELTYSDYNHMMYSLRSSLPLPFLPIGGATNPDGIGHAWVKELWVTKKYRRVADLVKAGVVLESDFEFIGAKPTDNPTFTPQIQARLMGFEDENLVKARWEGSWDLVEGNRFSRFNERIHVKTEEEIRKELGFEHNPRPLADCVRQSDMKVYGSFDFGTDKTAASAFYIHVVNYEGKVFTVHECYMQGRWLDEQAEIMKQLIATWRVERVFCDPALESRESDGMSRLYKFAKRGVRMMPGNNNRIEGWASLDEFLAYSETEPPMWAIIKTAVNLIEQLQTAPRCKRRPEDVSPRFKNDHGLDSVRYFLHTAYGKPIKRTPPPQWGSPAWMKQQANREKLARLR